jgi:hypothetical protein
MQSSREIWYPSIIGAIISLIILARCVTWLVRISLPTTRFWFQKLLLYQILRGLLLSTVLSILTLIFLNLLCLINKRLSTQYIGELFGKQTLVNLLLLLPSPLSRLSYLLGIHLTRQRSLHTIIGLIIVIQATTHSVINFLFLRNQTFTSKHPITGIIVS